MVQDQLSASHTFDEFLIWKTKLPQAKNAVLPPANDRPNPIVTETMVYVSVFSPGAVYALERQTGRIVWHREIPKYGGSALHLAPGKLFAKTSNTLFALEPETGRTIWSFCPHGESGETIYSHPALCKNALFIGDRCGYLYCLDSKTGSPLWKKKTNGANKDVNTTPVVMKSRVIVGTNASSTVAYGVSSGKKLWSRKLDGPSVYGPLVCEGLVVMVADSICFLRPENGRVVRSFTWTNDRITSAVSTGKFVVGILRGGWPPTGNIRLVGLDRRGLRFTRNYKAFVAFLSYGAETKLIYVSHLEGIDIVQPKDGSVALRLKRESTATGYGAVDTKGNTIYILSDDGSVYALRHPTVPSTRGRRRS